MSRAASRPRKRSVLFVDDEPDILEGMRLTMHGLRREWQASYAKNANEAMAAISARLGAQGEEAPFDVVVTDIRMPGMDGVTLLKLVQQSSPSTVRIILSGFSDHDCNLKAVKPAHQFLSKPCEPDALKESLSRAAHLGDMLKRDAVRRMLLGVDSLQTLPAVLLEINQELALPEPSLEKIGRVVERDPAMAASLLKVVNSAFFGLFKEITSPAQAVTYLGTETMRGLALGIHLFGQAPAQSPLAGIISPLWRHGLQVGQFAKTIAQAEGASQQLSGMCFVAGMLHDIGKLLFASHFSEGYGEILRMQAEEGRPCVEAEQAIYGVDHAEAGGCLLGIWGLPAAIFNAVQWHHAVEKEHRAHPGASFTPALAVHVANALDLRYTKQGPPGMAPLGVLGEGTAPVLNVDALASRGLADRLPAWRTACLALLRKEQKEYRA